MGRECVLELGGPDVEASGDDHVVLAVEDVDVPVLVDPPHVAGEDPVVDETLLGCPFVLPEPQHLAVAAQGDLPDFADGQRLGVVVDDLQSGEGQRPAGGTERTRAVDRGEPLAVLGGPEQKSANSALTPLVVPVEHVDREGLKEPERRQATGRP